jgi:hypothetical protein
MRKNLKAAPAEIPDVAQNLTFNTKDRKIFYSVLLMLTMLFSAALFDIFNVTIEHIFNLIGKIMAG